jgi:hypothetical protein
MKLHLKQQNELVVNALMLEPSGEKEWVLRLSRQHFQNL